MAVGALVASTALVGRGVSTADASPRQHVAGSAAAGGPSADGQQVRVFDIPAGTLAAALDAYQAATGITVVIDPARVDGITAPAVVGRMSVEQALLQVLSHTTYTIRFTAADVVTVNVAVTEYVEVAGRELPRSARPVITEPLRDVPQTITVVPRRVIEEQGATTLRDVLRNVAGITFQAGEGGVPAGDQMTIRGFSARTDMFVDGIRDFGGYSRDPYNVEQVEVAKGPSSAISGRGSTGGAVNLVSKMPHAGTGYDAVISAGNAEFKRSTLDINQPLDEVGLPNAAFRLNAMWTDSGVPGRDAIEGARWAVAPSLGFGIGTHTRLTASYSHLTQDNLPEYGLPWVPANTNPELAEYANGQPPVDPSNFYGLRTRDYEDTVTDLGTVHVEHDFAPSSTIRNITRYGKTTRDSVITAPRFASVNTSTAINRQLQSRDMVDHIVANQTTLTTRFDAGASGHALVTGVEVASERSENYLRTGPAAPLADLFNPNPDDPYPAPVTRTGARNLGTARSAALYAFDTVTLGSRLEISGGLRWDRFDVDYEAHAATGEVTPLQRNDDMVSWRGGVVYKPRRTSSIYFGYGSSFNPSAEGLALTAATVTLAPEQTRSFEAGTKWDVFDESLALTAAVFRTDKTNARTPGVNAGDPPTVLAGAQRVSGIELSASGRLSERWTAYGAYAFMTSDIAASNALGEVDNALALTPEHTVSLWTTFQLPWDISIGGGAQFMDAVFRNATNTAVVPSYWVINTLASYEVNQHLTLRLNVNNLANEAYVDRIGGGHYIPGPRRSVQLSSAVKF
jgi:catecholate siderophore receptor